MAFAQRKVKGPSALALIEDATLLLRRASLGTLLMYYIGSVPFILGALYFIVDMSNGAFAAYYLVEASLAMAALYLWMKCWHTVFTRNLHALLLMEPRPRWSFRRLLWMVAVQATIQPSGLISRIIAAQLLIPYVWVYGFYQSATILGDGEIASVREVARRAWGQARLWPAQAHCALSLLFLFGFFVWLNVLVFTLSGPGLLKTLLGIETMFTRNPMMMFNTTLFGTTFALTYLCFDPFRKALYVLRCFHGQARQSGADLQVELQTVRARTRTGLAIAAMLLAMAFPMTSGFAQDGSAPSPAPATQVERERLDSAIERVLERREFAWRMPRAELPPEEKGWFTLFVEDISKWTKKTVKSIFDSIGKAMKWIRDWFPSKESSADSGDTDFSALATWLPWVAGLLVAGMLIWLIFDRRRSGRREIVEAEGIVSMPDLTAENVLASQLPEDGWLKMARELMENGDLRLAIRALYLASLAHLGSRELISIARHKSNLDYQRELQRRARSRESLLNAFSESRLSFECVWYGTHEASHDVITRFQSNLERIRTA